MIFRQLFEPISSTYTYLIACEESEQAILVDPVLPAWQRDLETLNSLGLRLAVTLDTQIHADHITAASRLKRRPEVPSPIPPSTRCLASTGRSGKANRCASGASAWIPYIPPGIPTAITPTSWGTVC
jgi:glyoxylase-like metal-dependent hydrolase (beta-lactamase superfamily II)